MIVFNLSLMDKLLIDCSNWGRGTKIQVIHKFIFYLWVPKKLGKKPLRDNSHGLTKTLNTVIHYVPIGIFVGSRAVLAYINFYNGFLFLTN